MLAFYTFHANDWLNPDSLKPFAPRGELSPKISAHKVNRFGGVSEQTNRLNNIL